MGRGKCGPVGSDCHVKQRLGHRDQETQESILVLTAEILPDLRLG